MSSCNASARTGTNRGCGGRKARNWTGGKSSYISHRDTDTAATEVISGVVDDDADVDEALPSSPISCPLDGVVVVVVGGGS